MHSESIAQQTKRSFSDKWQNNQALAFNETAREGSDINNWILTRNGWSSTLGLQEFLSDKVRVLDAGCGNGRVTNLFRANSDPKLTEIVGCDLVAAPIAQSNLSCLENVAIHEADLTEDLDRLGRFDFIYCQEVLHHTKNPRLAFANLSNLLSENGKIAIYVYKRKAQMREHADDFIREALSKLSYEDSLVACKHLAELGRALGEVNQKVDVPAVPILGIEAGSYDVQRFIYHFFLKCFWNNQLSFDENVAINYDWYHPQLCERYSIDEVRPWFQENNLSICFEHVDHYGITIHGTKMETSR